MEGIDLKKLIKNNNVNMNHYQDGIFYYRVRDNENGCTYQFEVPIKDLEAENRPTLLTVDKAIYFMRYIRKAIEDNKMLKL